MFGFGAKSIVGLDVGSSSIKAVELKKEGGQGSKWPTSGVEPLRSGHRGGLDDRRLGDGL